MNKLLNLMMGYKIKIKYQYVFEKKIYCEYIAIKTNLV